MTVKAQPEVWLLSMSEAAAAALAAKWLDRTAGMELTSSWTLLINQPKPSPVALRPSMRVILIFDMLKLRFANRNVVVHRKCQTTANYMWTATVPHPWTVGHLVPCRVILVNENK